MSTYILVRCPICRCSLKVRRVYIGKTVACRYCDQAFVIRLGDERITVQFPDPSGLPIPGPEANPGQAELPGAASEGAPSMVIDVRGAWDPEADRSLEVTRTDQDPSWPGVDVVQVDLGCCSPGVVTIAAPELERLRDELEDAGRERARLREQVQRLHRRRQADALRVRRLHKELDASQEARERLVAERQAALSQADQHQLTLDELSRSLCDAQSRHDAAHSGLACEYEEARRRWERERREEESRSEEQRGEHAVQLAAVVERGEEQLAAVIAELDQSRQAFETARGCHEARLARVTRELALATKQGEDRLLALHDQFERQSAALKGEIEAVRERSETGLRERDLANAQLGGALQQRDLLTATSLALRQQVFALESTLNASREEADTAREEARRGHEDRIVLRHTLELVERREQALAVEHRGLSATSAELQQQIRTLESALKASREEADTAREEARRGHEDLIHLRHMLELVERREQAMAVEHSGVSATSAELQQQVRALESALNAASEEAETAREEARCGYEDLIRLRGTLERTERLERAVAAENRGLLATAAEQQQQLRALEAALDASRLEADAARDEARREHQELIELRPERERIERLEQAAAAEIRALSQQIRDRQADSERERQTALDERLESHRRLAALQAELESRQAHREADLVATRRHFEDELRELRDENQQSRDETERVRQERDSVRSELQGVVQNHELLAQTLAMIELADEQSRAEVARRTAAQAEAEGQLESSVLRSEQLGRELVELRAELDRLRREHGAALTSGRVHAAEVAVGRPRLEEGWTTHRGSASYQGPLSASFPKDQDSRGLAARTPVQDGGASALSVYLPDDPPSKEFPSALDLTLVRAQVEVLNRLLDSEKSSGHVLIYQQRLAEFAQKIREASRLATNLANEVEQSRRRDEMQFHMYLVRRAEEIDKPRS